MQNYKNIIVLKDEYDGEINAIIFTNETEDTIQKAIRVVKEIWYDLECPDMQLNFILKHLNKSYDAHCIDIYDDEVSSVYY